jgi:O-acetyl-ADP-ribose deacetylase (regulator of RNase III)
VIVLQADITTLSVDAIVNAAHRGLSGGGGVDGAIHRAAGLQLKVAAMRLAPCEPGNAVITPGFDLPARFVIHTVGPIWHGGESGEPEMLRRAYESSFRVAESEPRIRSIAFPAISTGVYGYPKRDAAQIAVDCMRRHQQAFDRVIACLFDRESLEIYEGLVERTSGGAEKLRNG